MRKSGNPLLNFEIQIQEKSGKLNVWKVTKYTIHLGHLSGI
jgi:hypothetical protein